MEESKVREAEEKEDVISKRQVGEEERFDDVEESEVMREDEKEERISKVQVGEEVHDDRWRRLK